MTHGTGPFRARASAPPHGGAERVGGHDRGEPFAARAFEVLVVRAAGRVGRAARDGA